MAKNVRDRLSIVIDEVEAIAKQLRGDICKAATSTGLARSIGAAARRLQKQAAQIALQVERYAHELRLGLEGSSRKPARRRRRTKAAS
jgi:hypothetical protein